MKFEEAFNTVFEIEKKRSQEKGYKFAVEPKTAKILAFMWNMIASSSVLEDMAYIDEKNEIVSIPIIFKDENKESVKPKGTNKPSENEGLNGTEGTEGS